MVEDVSKRRSDRTEAAFEERQIGGAIRRRRLDRTPVADRGEGSGEDGRMGQSGAFSGWTTRRWTARSSERGEWGPNMQQAKAKRRPGDRRKTARGRPKTTQDRPETTRDRLVEAARQLFLAKGYEATGIAEILRATGINSGSLYYFFKTKEALLVAVLDRYVELLEPMVIAPAFAKTQEPIGRIFAVMYGYRKMLLATEFRQGCPIGNLALEMSEKSDVVREKIALNFTNWRKAIQTCLEEAFDGVEPSVDCAQLSSFVLTVMEGAVMQARAYRSIEPFDGAMAVLRQQLKRSGTRNGS